MARKVQVFLEALMAQKVQKVQVFLEARVALARRGVSRAHSA
jgi:hypothetical protein